MYRLVRGVYGQRQADVQMMRIKIPGGALTADQMDAFGEVVSASTRPLKKGHITTRENVQVHFIKLDDTPHVMRILGEAGLVTREACGNTVRNVAGDPLSGVKPEEPFYVAPLPHRLRTLLPQARVHASALPRKWKTSFSSGGDDEVVADIHDLAFLPKLSDRRDPGGEPEKGFEIRIGGGTSIMPRLAWTLYDFVPGNRVPQGLRGRHPRLPPHGGAAQEPHARAHQVLCRPHRHRSLPRRGRARDGRRLGARRISIPLPGWICRPEMIDEPPALVPVSDSDAR